MRCPRCYSEKNQIIRTQRYDEHDIRTHICKSEEPDDPGCGKTWTSIAQIDCVYVYNPEIMKEERIKIDEYNKKYLDHDLGRQKHPKQPGMFDENYTGDA